jgi:hypothetical protein
MLFQEAELDDRESDILILKFLEGETLRDIGLKHGRCGETIRLTILKSIRKIQEKVKEQGYKYGDFTRIS